MLARGYAQAGTLDASSALALFTDRASMHYDCRRASADAPASAGHRSARRCAARGKRRLVVPEASRASGCRLRFECVRDTRTDATSDLDGCEGALTGCDVAIAQTGTIVLCHGAGRGPPRALTLIPDYHLCVVRARSGRRDRVRRHCAGLASQPIRR